MSINDLDFIINTQKLELIVLYAKKYIQFDHS